MPCIKTKLRFHRCLHDDEDEFAACDEHGDPGVTRTAMEECWNSRPRKERNLSTRLGTSMKNGGVCSRDCDAEYIGFYCCLCQKFIGSDDVSRNQENNLVHTVGDTEHEFCDDCYTKNF